MMRQSECSLVRGVKHFWEEVDESIDYQRPKILPKEHCGVANLQPHSPMSSHQLQCSFTVMAVVMSHAAGSWWHLLEAPGLLQLYLLGVMMDFVTGTLISDVRSAPGDPDP